jgi:hypothetical protein
MNLSKWECNVSKHGDPPLELVLDQLIDEREAIKKTHKRNKKK